MRNKQKSIFKDTRNDQGGQKNRFLNEGSKVKMNFNLDDSLLKEVQKDKEKENNEV